MRHIALAGAVLLWCCISSCAPSEEGRVEDVVDELVDAINAHDVDRASTLYLDGELTPVSAAGDSSDIYRMLRMSYADDFDADDVRVAVIDRQAQAIFYLSGDVHRADTVAGRMMIRLKLEMANLDGSWKIVPGSEARETGT